LRGKNTTAFGLIVAGPCLTAHMLLGSFTKKSRRIEQYSTNWTFPGRR
jgi:biopolymer transport protein ExbB/TolQ